MINPFSDVNWHPDRKERRKFGASLMLGFPSLAAVFSLVARITSHAWRPFPIWLGAVGLAIGLVIWLAPQVAHPIYIAWYFLACCVGILVANALFCVFYYTVLTPLGVIVRTARPRFFRKQFDKTVPSYWSDAKPMDDANKYYRQF